MSNFETDFYYFDIINNLSVGLYFLKKKILVIAIKMYE